MKSEREVASPPIPEGTPRTDALAKWINTDAVYKAPEQMHVCQAGYINRALALAAELERELSAALSTLAQQQEQKATGDEVCASSGASGWLDTMAAAADADTRPA